MQILEACRLGVSAASVVESLEKSNLSRLLLVPPMLAHLVCSRRTDQAGLDHGIGHNPKLRRSKSLFLEAGKRAETRGWLIHIL